MISLGTLKSKIEELKPKNNWQVESNYFGNQIKQNSNGEAGAKRSTLTIG